MNHAISQDADVAQPTDALGRQIPTARNSERWMPPKHGAAAKYIPGQAAETRQVDRQEAIRKAIALRAAYRLERDCDIAFTGSPYQRGIQQVLFQLYSIREAESIDALIVRDRHLSGMAEGAYAFRALPLAEMDKINTLRQNAFALRLKELQK